jgi:toxin ParE1/3/4
MRRLIFTPAANADLIEIANYIEQTSGHVNAAEAFVGKLVAHCERIAASPIQLGRERPALLPGLRSVPSGKYLIFVRYLGEPTPDTVEVVNILRGRRDIEAFFKGGA